MINGTRLSLALQCITPLTAEVRRCGRLTRLEILTRFPNLGDEYYSLVTREVVQGDPAIQTCRGCRGGLRCGDTRRFLLLIHDLVDEGVPTTVTQALRHRNVPPSVVVSLDRPDSVVSRYVEQMQTIPQIGRATGLDYMEVVERLEAANVPSRRAEPDLECPEYLHYVFHVQGRNFEEIATEVGSEPIAVRKHLRKHGIPLERRARMPKAA